VLRALNHLAVNAQQVGALQRLQAAMQAAKRRKAEGAAVRARQGVSASIAGI
jgi:hypothetical protein